jgi:uncharacterized membrane protein YjgN (DUF898 family)
MTNTILSDHRRDRELAQVPKNQARHQFSFSGSASEYFSIWIVNLALTVITLGLYSPWAKVRRERYLMSHTELAGTQFEYTADPWKIFKGRLLLLATLMGLSASRALPGWLILVAIPLVVLIWSWILVSANRFRARYTSYRNLSFNFAGTVKGAFMRCVLPKGAAFMTLGLLAPWAKCVAKRFTLNNLRYGLTSFRSHGTSAQLYRVYVVGLILFILGVAIMVVGTGIIRIDLAAAKRGELATLASVPRVLGGSLLAIFGFCTLASSLGYIRLGIARRMWDGATLGNCTISWVPSVTRYLFIAISNSLIRTLTLGLATPWCVIRTRRFLVDGLALIGPAKLDDFSGEKQRDTQSFGDQAAEVYDLDLDFGF